MHVDCELIMISKHGCMYWHAGIQRTPGGHLGQWRRKPKASIGVAGMSEVLCHEAAARQSHARQSSISVAAVQLR